jgi:hypothetical protein
MFHRKSTDFAESIPEAWIQALPCQKGQVRIDIPQWKATTQGYLVKDHFAK